MDCVIIFEIDESVSDGELKELLATENFFILITPCLKLENIKKIPKKYHFNFISFKMCEHSMMMNLNNVIEFADKYLQLKEEHQKLEDTVFDLAFATTNVLEQNEFLELMANKDGLTMLFNHSYFKEKLKDEFQRASRYGTRFAVALLDLDFFKQVNDVYGHLKGDEVLRTFAKILEDTVRTTDIAARYGGEEFAVLFPETGVDEAFRAIERVRTAMANTTFASEDGIIFKCTFSAGITIYSDVYKKVEDMLENADKALYMSKDNGRDQSTII